MKWKPKPVEMKINVKFKLKMSLLDAIKLRIAGKYIPELQKFIKYLKRMR